MMHVTVIKSLGVALLLVTMVGCATQKKSEEYQKAKLGPPLQLPPGLSTPASDDSIKVLEGNQVKGASYSDYACDCKNGNKRPATAPTDEADSGHE
jgi:uncharacterized lipoprotein